MIDVYEIKGESETLADTLSSYCLVPVVQLDRVEAARPLAEALIRGGLSCAEITFRTDAAAASIAAVCAAYPDMFVGAGTILTTDQADAAVQAGARFLVSPGFNPAVVEHCLKKGYPILPGVCTPSEVERALSYGLTRLKFFPSEAAGGTAMLKALSAPYRMVRFMPTGGIHPGNVRDYLACPSVFACGGSWMVPRNKVNGGCFAEIEQLTAQAAALLKG